MSSQLIVEINSARGRPASRKRSPSTSVRRRPVDTTVMDISEALGRRAASRAERLDAPPEDAVPRSPELEALETELARKHWEAWLDLKIPALQNRTPRQAARRRRVVTG